MKNQIGIIGLGVMGNALARNILNQGYSLSVYNKTFSKTKSFVENYSAEGYADLKSFLDSLKKPRIIILMISDFAVDQMIDELLFYLEEEDILIDGGNSFYKDTFKRIEKVHKNKVLYLGMGVSGGEKGALEGPSLMPSGDKKAYDYVENILKDIAAKRSDSIACVQYIGPEGSGHFVKMVHNAIEYAIMQLIAESYSLLKSFGYDLDEIADIFDHYNQGRLQSYLMEITSKIVNYQKKDEYLIEKIKDEAKQKGTGKWCAISSFEYEAAIPTLIEAVQARTFSQQPHGKDIHVRHNKSNELVDGIEKLLYLSIIMIYEQGFGLMNKASETHHWELNLSAIASIWQEGCIIKSSFLKQLEEVFKKHKSILEDENLQNEINQALNSWMNTIIKMMSSEIYAPVSCSAWTYYMGKKTALGMNLIMAQRDYFGAHGYERIDQQGQFHSNWNQ